MYICCTAWNRIANRRKIATSSVQELPSRKMPLKPYWCITSHYNIHISRYYYRYPLIQLFYTVILYNVYSVKYSMLRDLDYGVGVFTFDTPTIREVYRLYITCAIKGDNYTCNIHAYLQSFLNAKWLTYTFAQQT